MNRHERRALGINGTDAARMAEGRARLARLAQSTPTTPKLITPPTLTAITPTTPGPITPPAPSLEQMAEATGHLRDFDQLTGPAFARLCRNLEGYGSVLSEKHQAALMVITARFTMLANGHERGRFCYDLACGGGKTQAIIAWCATLVQSGLPYSVAVCSSKVEALCEIRNQMIKNGVPAEKIGLLHSYQFDPAKAEAARLGQPGARGYASLPKTDGNDQKPILLITHARLRGGADIGEYMTYHGAQRSLVLYDETLFHSDHRVIGSLDIEQGAGFTRPLIRRRNASPDLTAALDYIDRCVDILIEELDRQQDDPECKPRTITLPRVEPDALQRMITALPEGMAVDPARQLLQIAHADLRVINNSQGHGGVVQYDIVVPAELKNIAVLDASYAIRDLVSKHDKTVRIDPLFESDIADYRNVTINQLRHAAGRGTMTENFREQKAENRTVSSEIVALVKGLPEDQGVLLFTFKPRKGLNMAETIKADLEVAGVDIQATVNVEERQPDGTTKIVKRPRLQWLTWGNETCTSDYVYCRHVVFAGVLHRADDDIEGAILAQRDDLLLDVPDTTVREARTSEVVHCIYQGMARGSMRVLKDGKARSMTAWLLYPSDDIRPDLDLVMPGVVWAEWDAKHLMVKSQKIARAAAAISRFLLALPDDTLKVSVRALKKDLGLGGLAIRSFQLARDAALEQLASWGFEGRAFVRKVRI